MIYKLCLCCLVEKNASAVSSFIFSFGNLKIKKMSSAFGFIGLGTMGYHMAHHLCKMKDTDVYVWNRTQSKALKHAKEFGTTATSSLRDVRNISSIHSTFILRNSGTAGRGEMLDYFPVLTRFEDCGECD